MNDQQRDTLPGLLDHALMYLNEEIRQTGRNSDDDSAETIRYHLDELEHYRAVFPELTYSMGIDHDIRAAYELLGDLIAYEMEAPA